jgi:chorismate mutase
MAEQQNSPTHADSPLGAFRKDIDALDTEIIALIKRRTDIVKQVAELKASENPHACPLRPGREAEQLRRVTQQFKDSPFSQEAAAALWRVLIGGSLAVEGEIRISVYATDERPDLYWLAREYFGGFMHIRKEPSIKRVIGDILDGKANIGVVPPLQGTDAAPWWPDLALPGHEWPKIFAHLPFLDAGKQGREAPRALAIGHVTPEETGEDVSYIVLDAEDNTSMHKLQTAFAQAGLSATWIDVQTHADGRRRHLVEIQGFIPPAHPGFQGLAQVLGKAVLQHYFLGAYATPISLHAHNPARHEPHRHDASAQA